MTPEEAFLQDICEHPEDDTPRLIFADWLEEHDNPERAEFIRLQCDLAGRDASDTEVKRLKARESGLIQQFGNQWLGRLHDLGIRLEPDHSPRFSSHQFWHIARFERGFIEKVSLPYTDFVYRAETLFEAAPTIRSVRLVRTGEALPATPDDVLLLADSNELSRLLVLDLSRLFIGDDRVALIVSSQHLYRLRRLELGLSSVGGLQTVLAVARNRSLAGLAALNLSSLNLTDVGLRGLVAADHLGSLNSLDLSCNRITSKGARLLAAAPHLRQLTHLNLTYNSIEPAERALLRDRFGDVVRI